MTQNRPEISIGLPVYNGEQFIQKKIESILNQTVRNFELIISDNASTDKTAELIENFAKKDNRIRFFKHERNMGPIANFNFVLQQARGDYFLWTAVDDIQLPTFLEKNLQVLKTNSKVACSISRVQLYGGATDQLKLNQSDSSVSKLVKKFKKDFGYIDSYPASGPYKKRVKEYFRNLRHNQIFYGMYRIEQIQNAHVKNSFIMTDCCTTLNILKFGELYAVDEVLLHVYDEGISRRGMISATQQMQHGITGRIFLYYPFTRWCVRNLDKSIIIENLNFFVKLNCIGLLSLIIDILRRFGLKI